MSPEAFESALSRLLDGDLSPEEFSALGEYLSGSEQARRAYLDFVDLHNVLGLELSLPRMAQPGSSEVVPVERILARQQRRSLRVSAMAAAALILLLGIVFKMVWLPDPEPLLSFRVSPDTLFSVTHSGTEDSTPEPGVLVKGSRLSLTQGAVELTLASGVTSIVRAPAALTLLDGDLLRLDDGVGWFHVPKEAIGFRVLTTDLLVTDLGTEFGVISTHTALDEVHVLKGKVELRNLNGVKHSEVLAAGEARIVGPAGRLVPVPVRPEEFEKSLPSGLPFVHLAFDSLEEGRLAVEGNHGAVASITALLVPAAGGATDSSLVPGRHGQALRLSGRGDHVLTNWPGISGKGARSVLCWVRIPEGEGSDPAIPIVGWGSLRNNGKWKIHATPGGGGEGRFARISLGDVWYTAGESRLDDGRWHHVAAVSYGRALENGRPDLAFYVDGRRVSLTPSASAKRFHEVNSVTGAADSVPLLVGAAGLNQKQSFRGAIDELYVFEGALLDESIRELAAGALQKD